MSKDMLEMSACLCLYTNAIFYCREDCGKDPGGKKSSNK